MAIDIATITVRPLAGGPTMEFRCDAKARDDILNVLEGKAYPLVPFLRDVKAIVDVGAHVGAAALYFSVNYPLAKVFAFEPYKASFDLAVSNTASIAAIRLFNIGLDDADRTAKLFLGKQVLATNSVLPGAPYNSSLSQNVNLRRASSALAELAIDRIDILKIDTEGCEVPILGDLLPAYAPRAVHLEYHNELDRRTLDAMLADQYLLTQARATKPHVGNVTYVRADCFSSNAARDRYAVGLKVATREAG